MPESPSPTSMTPSCSRHSAQGDGAASVRPAGASIIQATMALSRWLERSWLDIMTGLLASTVLGALLDPLLFVFGYDGAATRVFAMYHVICAQIPSHSYFLLGYQVALCFRNLAIYASLLGGSVIFRWVWSWLPPLDWKLWLMTMVPIAWDGGTQLFGWRESVWELRTLTGALFGLGVCWFLLPRIRDAVSEGAQSHVYEATPAP